MKVRYLAIGTHTPKVRTAPTSIEEQHILVRIRIRLLQRIWMRIRIPPFFPWPKIETSIISSKYTIRVLKFWFIILSRTCVVVRRVLDSHRGGPGSILGQDMSAGLRIRIHFIRIRIQHFMLNTDPDSIRIRIQGFNDQDWKKITAEIFFFGIKNYNISIPRPP